MSAASSACCACSASLAAASARSRAASLPSLNAAIARTCAIRRPRREPHHAIHQHALFGAPDLRFIRRRGRRVERRLRQPVDHFLQSRQRRIHRVLRHHARRAVELQREADRHVRRDRRRADRIEAIARWCAGTVRDAVRSPAAAAESRPAPASAPSVPTGFSVAASASSALR